jgi:DNA primase
MTRQNPYLYEYVKKSVDLPEFLETEVGCKLRWNVPQVSASTICPLHQDSKPSFNLKHVEEDGIWIYHCLGCGAKGTVVDFFMQYYNIDTAEQALIAICEKFGFKDGKELAIKSIQEVSKKVDLRKKMEYTHIVTANQCRMLLTKKYDEYQQWIGEAYRKMNKALDEGDVSVIENIGAQASAKMRK